MIELELFYKTVEAKIREEHTDYLEGEKRARVPIALPMVDELPSGDEWKKLNFFERVALKYKRRKQIKARNKAQKKEREIRIEDKLLKGYNKGIRKALRILNDEFKTFEKRLKEEAEGRSRF